MIPCIFLDQMTTSTQGLVIIIDNREAVEDRSNSLQKECHKEVQNLTKLFNKLKLLVLFFSSLSLKPLLHLLKGVNEVAATSSWNGFVLIILSKGKTREIYCNNNETLKTKNILSCLSNVKCPQLFFFQTILTEDVCLSIIEDCLPNGVVLSAYCSQNESQVSIFINEMQPLCYTKAIGDVVDEINTKIRDSGHFMSCRNPDFQNGMILADQSPYNK